MGTRAHLLAKKVTNLQVLLLPITIGLGVNSPPTLVSVFWMLLVVMFLSRFSNCYLWEGFSSHFNLPSLLETSSHPTENNLQLNILLRFCYNLYLSKHSAIYETFVSKKVENNE